MATPAIDEPVRTGARNDQDAALVVGIEDYFMLPAVPHAQRDADAFRQFAIYTRGIPESRVRALGRGANREQMLAAIEELGQSVGPKGTMWVYFAGHGAADPENGERVLLGADAQADVATFQARAVKLSELREGATKGGGQAVLVLDTCYSGRARDGADLVAGKRFAVPSYAVAAGPKVIEWTAAGPGEWSGPLAGTDHGAFTYAVLGALRGWADGQRDGVRDGQVTAEEAQLYVTEALRTLGVTDQRPTLEGAGDWVLSTGSEAAPKLSAVGPAAPAPAPAAPPVGDPSLPGQLRISTATPILFVLDGQPLQPSCEGCMHVDVYDLSPGPHRLEVRNLFMKNVLTETVDIVGGQQIRLHYAKKALSETGRGPAVPVPAAAPPPPPPTPAAPAPAVDPGLELVEQVFDLARGANQAPARRAPQGAGNGGGFGLLRQAVNAEGFSDDKVALIVAAASTRRFTMAQVGLLLDELAFSEARQTALRALAPAVTDPENLPALMPHLKFSSEKELARSLFTR